MIPRAQSLLLVPFLLAGGCILPTMNTKVTGWPLHAGDAGRLSVATKQELFDQLGPPMAIVGGGEYVEVPAANVHHLDEMRHRRRWFGGGAWTQQGDAWLEPFAARRALRDTHRVYYWYATVEGGWSGFFLVGFSTRHSRVRELWVLVDEDAGIAEDAIFRER